MVVDAEPNMTEAKMNDIIKAAIFKETKELRKEIKKLRAGKPTSNRKRNDSPHPKDSRGQRQGALEKVKQSNNKNYKKKQSKGKKVWFEQQGNSADGGDKGTKPKSILRNKTSKNSSKKKSNNKNKSRHTGKGRQTRN